MQTNGYCMPSNNSQPQQENTTALTNLSNTLSLLVDFQSALTSTNIMESLSTVLSKKL